MAVSAVGLAGRAGAAAAQEAPPPTTTAPAGGPSWPSFNPKNPDTIRSGLFDKLGGLGGEAMATVIVIGVLAGIVGIGMFIVGRMSTKSDLRSRGTDAVTGVLLGVSAVVMFPAIVFGLVNYFSS